MEELQARHRKEQRDLQSRITQKKKQASKKTRKGVNDECERLESELRERQRSELAALEGHPPEVIEQDDDATASSDQVTDPVAQVDGVSQTPEGPSSTSPLPPSATHNNNDDSSGDGGISTPSNTTASPATDSQPNPKPNRQKARLARRAAERASAAATAESEAQTLPDLKSQERTRMLEAMSARKLREVEVRADGHCLYSAFADQLLSLDISITPSTSKVSSGTEGSAATPPLPYKIIRAAAAGYISSHPEDFVPFLEEPLEEYVAKVRDTGEWGGQVELLALAASYGVGINVLQDFGRVERIESGTTASAEDDVEEKKKRRRREVWLGYYKHGFGLGEHYNSLRRIG